MPYNLKALLAIWVIKEEKGFFPFTLGGVGLFYSYSAIGFFFFFKKEIKKIS